MNYANSETRRKINKAIEEFERGEIKSISRQVHSHRPIYKH